MAVSSTIVLSARIRQEREHATHGHRVWHRNDLTCESCLETAEEETLEGGDEGLDQENQAAFRRDERPADAVPGVAAQLRWNAGHDCGGDDVRGERADGGGAVLERHRRAQAKAAARIAAGARPGEASQP